MGAKDWLTTDLNLVEADADQLGRHLGWLVEDLRAHGGEARASADDLAALADQVGECLGQLAHFQDLLRRVRRAAA
jgi:hypothetical protein